MLKNKNHLISLDFFRVVAGFGVAISHYFLFFDESVTAEIYSIILVEFFFVLSGFVLHEQLDRVNSIKNLKIFYNRRWLRTLPLYFLILTFVALLTTNLLSFDYVKYLFFVQNIKTNFVNNNFFPIAWSLSVEELYYLIMPLIILVFKKSKKMIFSFFIIYFLLKYFFISSSYSEIRTLTFLRVDSIFVGYFFFLFHKKLKYKLFLSSISLVFLTLFIYKTNLILNTFDAQLIFLLVSLSSVVLMVTFIEYESLFIKFKLKWIMNFLSKNVYSVYLIHYPIINVLLFYEISSLMLYLIIVILISTFLYNYFELYFLRLRKEY